MMWSTRGICISCIFWMSNSDSGLGTLTNSIELRHIFLWITFYKYGSFLLEGFPGIWRSSICLDLWYILKGRNNKVFSNLDIDPIDTLKLAEKESLLWAEAHNSLTHGINQTRLLVEAIVLYIPGRWCFTDGSWKIRNSILDKGSITHWKVDGLMGGRNTRASQSPLHSEIKALIWAMDCMTNLRKFTVIFATDCSQLVKMVSEP